MADRAPGCPGGPWQQKLDLSRRNARGLHLETTWRDVRLPETDAGRRAFARGYFDAEGGIPRDVAVRFYIQFVQKNLEDLRFLHNCLEGLGITCGRLHNPSVAVDPDYWRFFIQARSHQVFWRSISTWHPRKGPLLEAYLARESVRLGRGQTTTL